MGRAVWTMGLLLVLAGVALCAAAPWLTMRPTAAAPSDPSPATGEVRAGLWADW